MWKIGNNNNIRNYLHQNFGAIKVKLESRHLMDLMGDLCWLNFLKFIRFPGSHINKDNYCQHLLIKYILHLICVYLNEMCCIL